MDTVIVRFGEIGTKTSHVRRKIIDILRQRIQDVLEHQSIRFEKTSSSYDRILIEKTDASKAAKAVSGIPGVANTSPVCRTNPDIEKIKQGAENLEIGDSFGVKSNRSGEQDFDTQELNIKLGAHIEDITGASVDLDNPDTWVEVDVREDEAYLFTERFKGPDGYPVGTQGEYAALISGGIDSPVAAYKMMTRGAEITPVYFYNKPIAAEDHLLRFKQAVRELEKYHPSKKWFVYIVDMGDVNKKLLELDRGRMVLHRIIMFRVAERIAEEEGLEGIVTGESLGQKSSQTSENMEVTSSETAKPILRPLITESKNSIVEEARRIDTFRNAEIASACKTLSPDNPATSLSEKDLNRLKSRIDIDEMVEKAFSNTEKQEL